MANVDAPRGGSPARHLSGGVLRASSYLIASGYDTNIFTGDFVKLVAGGGIEVAAANQRLLGTFAGVRWVDDAGAQHFSKRWTADATGTDIQAFVYDDPNIVYRMQADGAVAAADVGNLADLIATHAGDAQTKRSGMEVNSTTGTGIAQFRILGKVNDPKNAWGANVELFIHIHEHEFSRIDPATPGV